MPSQPQHRLGHDVALDLIRAGIDRAGPVVEVLGRGDPGVGRAGQEAVVRLPGVIDAGQSASKPDLSARRPLATLAEQISDRARTLVTTGSELGVTSRSSVARIRFEVPLPHGRLSAE
jgi:hypothetical protein